MRWLCRFIGHRWLAFSAEQCPAEYRRCARGKAIEHECNKEAAIQAALQKFDQRKTAL